MALDDILVSIGADISGYLKGLGQAQQATQNFESGLNSSSKSLLRQESSFSSAASATSKAVKAHDSYTANLERSQVAIKEQGVDLKAADKAYESYMKSVGKSSDSLKEQGVDLKAADKAMDEYISGLSQANEGIDDHTQKLKYGDDVYKDTAVSAEELAGGMIQLAGVFLTVTTVISGAIAALVGIAANFENAFIGVQKTVEGTPKQFADLRAEILGLSKVLPRSASEIAGVAEEAGRLGIKREDISRFAKSMIMMADASNMSATEAASSMARLMNIMGTSQHNVERLGSAITHMGNNTATTEAEILEMSRRLAGAAHQVGITEPQLVALAASMADVGISAEVGGTAMQKTMLAMNSAVVSGGDKLKAFAKIAGVSADQFKQSFQEDAMSAIILFIDGLNNISNSGGDVTATLKDVGLSNEQTIRTLLGLSASAEALTENVRMSNEAWDEGSALKEEAQKRYESLTSQLKILLNRVIEVAIAFGTPLMEALKGVLNLLEPFLIVVENLAEKFNSLSDATKKNLAFLAMLVPVLIGVVAAVIAINGAIILIKANALMAAGALTVFWTAITGPVGWATAAIVGLGGLFVWLNGRINQTTKEHQELIATSEELRGRASALNDEINDSAEAHTKQGNAAKEATTGYHGLIDKVEELTSKESRSADEKTLLASVIDELNGKVEGLNVSYEEQADKVSKSAEEMREYIDALSSQDKVLDSQKRLTEIIEQKSQVESELNEILGEQEILNDKLSDQRGASTKEIGEITSAMSENQDVIDELNATHKKLGDEYEQVSETMKLAQGEVDQAIAEGVLSQTKSFAELEEGQQQMVEGMVGEYEKLAESATDMFQKITDESKVSFDEMKENMKHNAEMVGEWGENLEKLVDWGVSHGLIDRLHRAGPESAAEVAEIVKAGKTEAIALGELYEEGLDVAEENLFSGITGMEESSTEAIANMVRGMSSTFEKDIADAGLDDITREAISGVPEAIEEGSKAAEGAANNFINLGIITPFDSLLSFSKFSKYGENVSEGVVKGIDKGKGEAGKSSDELAKAIDDRFGSYLEIKSPSRLFMRHGSDIVAGLTNGISSSTNLATSAMDVLSSSVLRISDMFLSTLNRNTQTETSRYNQTVKSATDTTTSTYRGSFSTLQSIVSEGMSRASSTISSGNSRIVSIVRGLNSGLRSAGSFAMGGFLSGLGSMAGSVISKAKSIANSVASTIRSALKVKSPSRVTMEIGKWTSLGLAEGIENHARAVERSADELALAAMPNVDLSYATPEMMARSINSRINGDVSVDNVRSNDDMLVGAINSLERRLGDLEVVMDGERVGRIVRPHINDQDAVEAMTRRYFD